ncbi:MAG: hypothetical protein QM636_09245, partial [Rhizobium sp.]
SFIAAILASVSPEIFGSCFEGSCGYAALYLFTPVATVLTAVAWWFVLRRAGLLVHLVLWFLFLLAGGYFVLDLFVWVASLTGLLWAILEVVLKRQASSLSDGRILTQTPDEALMAKRPDTIENGKYW